MGYDNGGMTAAESARYDMSSAFRASDSFREEIKDLEKKMAELQYLNRKLENTIYKLKGGRVECKRCGYIEAVMTRATTYAQSNGDSYAD